MIGSKIIAVSNNFDYVVFDSEELKWEKKVIFRQYELDCNYHCVNYPKFNVIL